MKYGSEKPTDSSRSGVALMPAMMRSIWPLLSESMRPEKLCLTATGSPPRALQTILAICTS